ncbi:hypothetical protein [Streptomyces bluensis]|uniref:Uncharacterized protein n=1 Tax=Streptomyces bluensis TaxID=33897 RepID=A0ABW6UTZ8_9ACTN
MTSTLTDKAVVGRRVEFAFYREQATYWPGIITALTGDSASLRIRLDGTRSNLAVQPDYEHLRYLDQITDVPELPMGRFQPTVEVLDGEWEGVPICSLGEDGALIALTDDLAKAVTAMNTYRRDMAGCLYDPEFDTVTADGPEAHWAVFEWEPEDAECPWLMSRAQEGDEMAVHIHYLPA